MRRQLTLFVEGSSAERLDSLRRTLDPVQASLIRSHVTVCREDEILGIDADQLLSLARHWPHGPLSLTFGPARRFGGHGILLPCQVGSDRFNRLRQWLLRDSSARQHEAHITLAHPRNPQSAANTDAALESCPRDLAVTLGAVTLIEQSDTSAWKVIDEAPLGGTAASEA